MTIINTIVAADRCAILADTSATDAKGFTVTSKALALPHLRAVSGAAGELDVWLDWVRLLLGGLPVGTTLGDLVATAPEFFRGAWGRTRGNPSSIVLAGAVSDDAVEAWLFSSPHFAARRFAPGVWLQPGVLADPAVVPDEPTGPGSRFDDSGEPIVLGPPQPWCHGWADSVRLALAAVRQQREQRRVTSGGSLEMVEVAPHMTVGHRLDDLEFLEALPA